MSTINLEIEILRENDKTLASEQIHLNEQAKLDAEVEKVLTAADDRYKESLMDELGFDYKRAEAVAIRKERDRLAAFPQNRIMSKDAIRATCVKYGLRFLPTRFYKGQLDAGIGPAMEQYRGFCGGEPIKLTCRELVGDGNPWGSEGQILSEKPQFYIAAPATEFILQPRPRDPLLFARLSMDKFFLILKWGDDLKTADLRTGHTDANNWNSPYTEDGLTTEQRNACAQFGNASFDAASNALSQILGMSSLGASMAQRGQRSSLNG